MDETNPDEDKEKAEGGKDKKRSKSEMKISSNKMKIDAGDKLDNDERKVTELSNKDKASSKKKLNKNIDANQTKISNSFLNNSKVGEKRNFKETEYKFEEIEKRESRKFKR